VLFLISAWVCGPDVERLGDHRFYVRHPAHERLKGWGWVAYPALLRGVGSDVPERASRCGELLDRLDGLLGELADVEAVARGVDPLPDVPTDAFMKAVCGRVDVLGGWTHTANSWLWVKASPYRYGDRASDCRHVIGVAAARRGLPLFFPLVPSR
ncbi:MAG: hypothetical protein VKJ09_15800, partial [Leptolyngbya sp.]|nr:hypothetical protein [Leptolyngbya sp.]